MIDQYAIAIRQRLHRIPETAFTEFNTSELIAAELKSFGLDVLKGVAGTGVVGRLSTGRPGPIVALRADMDALPIHEETGLEFASERSGFMHACGHDGHMAMVLAAARLLAAESEDLIGEIIFLFQPAEEGPGGAELMISSSVLVEQKIDYIFGCHIWPTLEKGKIGVKDGPLMASMSRFDIRITGKSGHGAMPHLCIDALDTGVQTVNALQRVVSRMTDPLSPTVLSIGEFHSGQAFNIIPGTAKIGGTVRTYDNDLWKSWEDRIYKVAYGVCASMGADCEVTVTKGYPALVNDSSAAEIITISAIDIVGAENVVVPDMTMGSEDFAFYLRKFRGCFFFLGAGEDEREPLHHPRFDFDESILAKGAQILSGAARLVTKG